MPQAVCGRTHRTTGLVTDTGTGTGSESGNGSGTAARVAAVGRLVVAAAGRLGAAAAQQQMVLQLGVMGVTGASS
jgi:hypothetical protein